MNKLCKSGNIGYVDKEGVVLTISYNETIYCEIDINHTPFETGAFDGFTRSSNSVDSKVFNDSLNNKYEISIFIDSQSQDTGFRIESIEVKNNKAYNDFCNNMDIQYAIRQKYKYYFSLKLSKEKGISSLVSFAKDNNTNDILIIDNLTQLKNQITLGSLVYVVAGGDKNNTKLRKLDYKQGLYGIAKVVEEPYSPQGDSSTSYMINLKFIYFFNKVIIRDDLYPFTNTKNIPNIGVMTKGEQNQAISQLDSSQFKAILDASIEITDVTKSKIYDFFSWLKDDIKNISTNNYSSLTDNMVPALNVKTIAKVFANYLITYNSENTSTLIGIFGKWGRGKTYFFKHIQDYINKQEKNKKKIYFATFQPWKYQQQESAWAYLYETLLKSYLDNKSKDNITKLKAIYKLNVQRLGYWTIFKGFVIISLSAIWVFAPLDFKLSSLGWAIGLIGFGGLLFLYKTYSFITKNKHTALDLIQSYGKTKDYSNYLGFQNEIEQEIKYLLETYIDSTKERLILFIDDLDRCDENLIINIIDGLRLVLDNKSINSRLTIITAIDETILIKAIHCKYTQGQTHINAKQYIEKFFLMGIKLGHLNEDDINELVTKYTEQLNTDMQGSTVQKTYTELIEDIQEGRSIFNSTDSKNEVGDKIFEDVSTVKSRAEEFQNTLMKNGFNGEIRIEQNDTHIAGSQTIDVSLNNGEKRTLHLAPHDLNKIVLNESEILSIKKILTTLDDLTPRKINILLHRYLLFKSFIFTALSEDAYKNFNERDLVELLFSVQKEENLKTFIAHYEQHKTPMIQNILNTSDKETIERKNYILLVKFAEMVSPF